MTMNLGRVKSMVKPYYENYKALFIEVKLTLHEIHLFTKECVTGIQHIHNVVQESRLPNSKTSYHPKETAMPLKQSFSVPLPPTRNNPDGLQ